MNKVLIIERDERTSTMLSSFLTDLGFETEVVYAKNRARSQFMIGGVVAIFFAVETTTVFYHQFLPEVKRISLDRKWSDPKIIFLIDLANSSVSADALRFQHNAVLQKPFTLDRVYDIVRSIIPEGMLHADISNHYEKKIEDFSNFSLSTEQWVKKLVGK